MRVLFKIALFIFIFSTLSAFAKTGELQSISLSENINGYDIVLNSNESIQYKKGEENQME